MKYRWTPEMRAAVSAGAPEAEIEITPAMIEAGYRIFAESGITDDPLEADKLVLAEIYEAMARLDRKAPA